MTTRSLLAPILGLTLVACAGRGDAPLAPPGPEELASVPGAVVLGGVTLTLETYLWRDFMPPSPPEGRPLAARLVVRSSDGSSLPSGLVMTTVSVYYQGQTWLSSPVSDPSPNPTMYVARSSGGPLWGPGVRVNVSVTLVLGRQRIMLSAKNQYIHQTT